MKYSNFQPVKQTDNYIHATVDITTGALWWKKTTTHRVAKYIESDNWRFTDLGDFTDGYEVENLAIAHQIQQDLAKDEANQWKKPDH